MMLAPLQETRKVNFGNSSQLKKRLTVVATELVLAADAIPPPRPCTTSDITS